MYLKEIDVKKEVFQKRLDDAAEIGALSKKINGVQKVIYRPKKGFVLVDVSRRASEPLSECHQVELLLHDGQFCGAVTITNLRAPLKAIGRLVCTDCTYFRDVAILTDREWMGPVWRVKGEARGLMQRQPE